MRQLHNTIVLTGNTRTGKSTAIRQFLSSKNGTDGFLTLDVEYKRMLYFLNSPTLMAFETEGDQGDKTESIGRFHFLKSAFEKAKLHFRHPLKSSPHWWVVDEIGPLEFNHSGFEPDFSEVLERMEQQDQACLLVVVREKLIEVFHHQYGSPACIVSSLTLEVMKETTGVVLCGGKSNRMGTPKAWLCYYNDQPQFQWVSSLLENMVSDVVIANGQLDLPLNKEWTLVPDLEKDQGPAAGVLAAFRKNPNHHLLVCGCDYPLVRMADLVRLVAEGGQAMAVCYTDQSSASMDPLVCFYHSSCLPVMEEWYQKGNRSLRHFLQTIPHKVLIPHDVRRMTSVDDTTTFHQIKSRLHGTH
ncbi:MAG: molybdenum cofactor guanylyltransferase [Saprospiraceae bacterium]|nr:molybdenum cofactor guanylyltransferase [Saprospiraceae bacterium]